MFSPRFSRPIPRFCKIELHRERFWQKYGANFKGGQGHIGLLGRGGWSLFLSSRPAVSPWGSFRACPLQAVALRPCLPFVGVFRGAFLACLHGFLDGCNFWPFLPPVLACIALSFGRWGFPWVGWFWGLCGAFLVVILFACVPCPPAKGKKPFLPLVCLCSSVLVSLCRFIL